MTLSRELILGDLGTEIALYGPKADGAARTMKLFRMAFWLGVVIYNLPSPASQPAAPESQLNGSQGLAIKAPGQSCPQRLVACIGRLSASR